MDEATDKMSTANWGENRTISTENDDSEIASASSEDYDGNTEQIRAEIEDTRAEMSQTINEIQERLSPEHLMGQVKETVREATIGKVGRVMEQVGDTIVGVTEPARQVAGRAGTAIKETGRSVGESMWRNPIPVALIGLGVGMLVMRNYSGSSYGRTYSTPRVPKTRNNLAQTQHLTGGTSQSTANPLNQVRETASNLANRSTEALTNLGSKAKDGASAVSTQFERMLHDNPLAVGAMAVAAGTAIGLMIPSTEFESEYIGETSEMLMDRAQEVARGALDKVQDAAHQMTSEAQPHA